MFSLHCSCLYQRYAHMRTTTIREKVDNRTNERNEATYQTAFDGNVSIRLVFLRFFFFRTFPSVPWSSRRGLFNLFGISLILKKSDLVVVLWFFTFAVFFSTLSFFIH